MSSNWLNEPSTSTGLGRRPPNPPTTAPQAAADMRKIKRFGESVEEKLIILTGNVERTIEYAKHVPKLRLVYMQVFGEIVSVADGAIQYEKKFLLRDGKNGPILHVSYYVHSTFIKIGDFYLGLIIRAVGTMTGPNTMRAFSIETASYDEIEEVLPRMCEISDVAVKSLH